MFEYAITKTVSYGGTITEETKICIEQKRRVRFSLQVIGSGSLYCSVGTDDAVVDRGIYVDADNPLLIEIPVTGEIHVINDGSTGVIYVAAEGLL